MKVGAPRRRDRPRGGVATPVRRVRSVDAAVDVTMGARIPRRLYRCLRVACVEANRNVQDFVTEALHEYLRRRRRDS